MNEDELDVTSTSTNKMNIERKNETEKKMIKIVDDSVKERMKGYERTTQTQTHYNTRANNRDWICILSIFFATAMVSSHCIFQTHCNCITH